MYNYEASLIAQWVKNPPAMQETWLRSLGWEDPLEKGKTTHSSILAWRIPWGPWGHKKSDMTEQLSLTRQLAKRKKGDKTAKGAVIYFPLCDIFGCVLFPFCSFFIFLSFQRFLIVVKKNMTSNLPSWDFPGGPVADSSHLVQGAWVQSLLGELGPTCSN